MSPLVVALVYDCCFRRPKTGQFSVGGNNRHYDAARGSCTSLRVLCKVAKRFF